MNIELPFIVVIDSQEQHPFSFHDIVADKGDYDAKAKKAIAAGLKPKEIKLHVPTRWQGLGAGQGDYSIGGLENLVSIERKSLEDCQATVLAWDERRERFQRELDNLQSKLCKAVIVEASFGQVLATAPEWGKKSAVENKKILHRQILAYQQDFSVPWIFCDTRRFAEVTTIRMFQRFFKNYRKDQAK